MNFDFNLKTFTEILSLVLKTLRDYINIPIVHNWNVFMQQKCIRIKNNSISNYISLTKVLEIPECGRDRKKKCLAYQTIRKQKLL